MPNIFTVAKNITSSFRLKFDHVTIRTQDQHANMRAY